MNLAMNTSERQKSRLVVLAGCGASLLILIFVAIAVLLLLGPVVGNVFSNLPDTSIGMNGVAQAWIDENENGIWEAGESPLQEVEFSITYSSDSWNTSTRTSHTKSNWRGRGNFPEVRLPYCPDRTEVYAKAPDGYRLTTPEYIDAGEGCVAWDRGIDNPFLFGFTYLPGIPTVTPFPPAPNCTLFPTQLRSTPREVTFASNNTIWFRTLSEGVFNLDPTTNVWKNYRAEDGLASNEVRSLAISEDNIGWFGTDQGISRFDGTFWTTYTITNGLNSNSIVDVTIDPDGTVWSTTCAGGIFRFVPDTNTWIAEVAQGDSCSDVTFHIYTATDGSLWLATIRDSIIQAVPATSFSDEGSTINYEFDPFESPDDLEGIEAILPTNDKLWILTWSHFGYFDLETEEWQLVESDPKLKALALDSNGAVWLGMHEDGIRRYTWNPDNQSGFWTYYIDYELADSSIWTMTFAPDGMLWVGTSEGVARCVIQD